MEKMPKPFTYSQLPVSAQGRFIVCLNMFCSENGNNYSATRGDYFLRFSSEVVKCIECQKPMVLACEDRQLIILEVD